MGAWSVPGYTQNGSVSTKNPTPPQKENSMATFTVTLLTSASQTVSVEADSFEEAMDRAYDKSELYTIVGNSFDLGDAVVAYICNEDTGKEYEEDTILSGVVI